MQTVDITDGSEGVLRDAGSNAKRGVKRSRKEMSLRAAAVDSRQDFLGPVLQLTARSRRRIGVPTQPRRYWSRIWNLHEQGLAMTIGVYCDDALVASGVFLLGRSHAIYKYGASEPSAWQLRPNHLMFSTAFDRLAERGARTMDFGLTDLANDSLREVQGFMGRRADKGLLFGYRSPPSTHEHRARSATHNHDSAYTCSNRPRDWCPRVSVHGVSEAGNQHGGCPRGALATTLGTLSFAPEALSLSDAERRELSRWRDDRWAGLEQRAGRLADRDASTWYELLVFERWCERTHTGGLPPAALALFYRAKRLIPRSIQLALRRVLIRRQGSPCFPAWPFERAGHDLVRIALVDALLERNVNAIRFPWFWPDGAQAAVVLTHDVESEQGLADALTIAAWEEQYGFRSSFNLVSDWYPIDVDRVRELAERGHEIGSHAIYHDRSLFSSRSEFERQLPLLKDSADRLVRVGFRSPSTHRVVDWLGELPFSYDCTMPHSDPYEPVPGGTATVWPFFHRDVVELPYTTPQDHTLFTLLGHTDNHVWHEQFDRVVDCNGLFQMLTHPDPDYLGRPAIGKAYRDTLHLIAGHGDIWVALPREVAAWWRGRAKDAIPGAHALARWTGTTVSYQWSEQQ